MVRVDKQVVHLDTAKRPKKEKAKKKKTNLVRNNLTKEDKASLKYASFEPLYKLWCEYFSGLAPADKTIDDRLLKADYHGALLMVTEADNQCQVGLHGIVTLETRYTIQMITRADKYITIPKQGSVFQFVMEGRVFSLFGDQMQQKPDLRGKKARVRQPLRIFLR
ncbi:unnamed protein product, partial [Mesorhabditis spiculigera]